MVKLNADTYGASNTNGWVTEFTLRSQESYQPGAVQLMTFAMKTVGTMDSGYSIDIIAHPTDKWRLGYPGAACDGYSNKSFIPGSSCTLRAYPGSDGTQANGFRIAIGSSTVQDYSSDFQAAGARQWVTMQFSPGNTLQPLRPLSGGTVTHAGSIVIEPPQGFKIVDSEAPQSVDGEDALVGLWDMNVADNTWELRIVQTTAFKDTQFTVKLMVENPSEATNAQSWTITVKDANEPFQNIIAATRDVRGFPVYSQMLAATLAHANQISNASNLIRFTLTAKQDLGHGGDGKMVIIAPQGFTVQKRCPRFEAVHMPDVVCKGDEARQLTLTFPQPASVLAGSTMVFDVEFGNPPSTPPTLENFWYAYTVRPDGIGADVAKIEGFELYPREFTSFVAISTCKSTFILRYTGDGTGGAAGIAVALAFSTAAAVTGAVDMSTSEPIVEGVTPNSLSFRLSDDLQAGFEYGFKAVVTIPAESPASNTWWLEHYRLTGDVDEPYQNVASKGTSGFRTQVLVDVSITAYNPVEEAWDNPTTIVFEPTADVLTMQSSQRAELLVQAPVGFTFLCPLKEADIDQTDTVTQQLPSEKECSVIHSVEDEKNKLHVWVRRRHCSFVVATVTGRYFDDPDQGLKAGTRYSFVVDMINPAFANSISNYFTLSTRVGGEVVEEKTVSGFRLTKRMSETRYISLPATEDRRAGFADNVVTFVMGLPIDAPVGGLLVLVAPKGFSLIRNVDTRSCEIVGTTSMGTRYGDFPDLEELSCVCPVNDFTAEVTLPRTLVAGDYAIEARVSNPLVTPAHNYWNILIKDDGNPRVTMISENWIAGLKIQEILNTNIVAYNPANSIVGEASPNLISIKFTTTSLLPSSTSDFNGGVITVTAPQGFHFPAVCRYFSTDSVGNADAGVLPSGTSCRGDGLRTVTLKTPMGSFLEPGTYGFRVLIENPSTPFEDFTVEDKKWEMKTLLSNGTMVDYNGAMYGFPIRHRARYFSVEGLSPVGLYRTVVKISFSLYEALPPQANITITTPEALIVDAVGQPCVYPTPQQIEEASSGTDLSTLLNVLDLRAEFARTSLLDTTQLPSHISCTVTSNNVIVLKNEDEERTGRSLLGGTTYEQIVTNVVNPQSTPEVNLWRIEAYTLHESAPETWAATGYTILPELEGTYQRACDELENLCSNANFHTPPVERGNDKVLYCVSSGGMLEVTLGATTVLEKGTPLTFSVTGYNADLPISVDDHAAQLSNLWSFITHDSDSAKTPLDRKITTGFHQLGIIYVHLISPEQTKVSVAENRVEIRLRLSTQARPTSYLRIWFPPGFEPVDDGCAVRSFDLDYHRYVGADLPFDPSRTFVGLPVGTICESTIDLRTGLMLIDLTMAEKMDPGLNYAFQVGAMNPPTLPPDGQNIFRFETHTRGVMLHLEEGFIFSCESASYVNLSSATNCSANLHEAEFKFDTLEEKAPEEEFKIKAYVQNPRFTPQPNTWAFRIRSPSGLVIDIRLGVPGFDITGLVEVTIVPEFTYKRHRNNIAVYFLPSTIMNRADVGNEVVLAAPWGFAFPSNCSHFDMKPEASAIAGYEIPDDYVFPPVGTTCGGSDNVLTVRFPQGAGLQRYRYIMRVDVMNAMSNVNPSITNSSPPFWSFTTRVNNEDVMRNVDSNMKVQGFWVTDLIIPQMGGAGDGPSVHIASKMCNMSILCLSQGARVPTRGLFILPCVPS
ncbi:hypothetical protein Pmar_PMAR010088 [Perkinsus marinus ATCC 50983]|uniref:Uncharacterized protein n=1 Tax=Perkinsus marinus (strain ATCC 50983 / TXsc) TaxID=423536 RepID=C5K4T1_PERM5|nr:hypothetical protein Pmar_PMAR010088 [Perkinsus marinus ATCC 50983]EER20353.1 hypothetical protein Pmar_PMAR010088 [Perkinsus marinus ATCC 50983]|eukprot:XP_002788557.1 hypothetical protein Pmar_PMAR010088 [Perkinsus marinus ATCC 50983]